MFCSIPTGGNLIEILKFRKSFFLMQIREVLDNDTDTVFRIVWVAIHFQLGASLYFLRERKS